MRGSLSAKREESLLNALLCEFIVNVVLNRNQRSLSQNQKV